MCLLPSRFGYWRRDLHEHLLIVKWIHIVSSIALLGTGLGSAYYMFFVNRSKEVVAQAEVACLVVRADWWFTTPTVVIQPTTGLWLALSMGLYVLAGACWLPVVWLQLRMAAMAQAQIHPRASGITPAGGSAWAIPLLWRCCW
jgi:uncharacterized membrane protein